MAVQAHPRPAAKQSKEEEFYRPAVKSLKHFLNVSCLKST
jgi:hypothetical protein